MLRGLNIRDMLLIERLELEFQPGLNVLTGETGAGKSILLDSLGFVLGWRGQADMVRAGAGQGEVTASFDLAADHPVLVLLEEAGLLGGQELVLRRINYPDGRKQAYINDRRCSGEVLRRIAEVLVEIHGQFDDRGLLNPRGHRQLLDDFARLSKELAVTRKTWGQVALVRKTLEEARDAHSAAEKDRAFLEHSVDELAQLSPKAGEDSALDTRRRLMQAGGRIREDIHKAALALGLEGAEGQLGDATRWLEGVEDKAEGRLAQPLAALERAISELGEAQRGVEDCAAALDFDPLELEATEERLFAIRALARKHGVQPDDLEGLHGELKARLAAIENGAAGISGLEEKLAAAEGSYKKAAKALGDGRKKAAGKLDKAMAGELAPLKMERAVFKTDIELAEPGPDGTETVQFTVATNPGAPSGPLNKIASGGELSRFLLALKVCLTAEDKGVTMIFDEIDRGVGGATADAVGRRLAALANAGQVLVVTHSPQVAALGQHHWRVEKSVNGAVTTSDVMPVSGDERINEIARMLAGDTITEEARAAAGVLLGASQTG